MIIRLVLYAVWRLRQWMQSVDFLDGAKGIAAPAGVLLWCFVVQSGLTSVASLLHSEPFHDELDLLSRDKITAAIAMCYDAFDGGPTVADPEIVKASVCPRGVASQAESIADWTARAIDDWREHLADESDRGAL